MKFKIILLLSVILLPISAGEITEELEEEMEENEEVEVLVEIDNLDKVENLENNFTVEEKFETIKYVKMELTPDEIEALNQENYTSRLEPNYKVETQLKDSNNQINNPGAWFSHNKGQNISVAVLDTGMYVNHSFLQIENHRDYTGEGIGDAVGHGTHVGGIINSQHPTYRGVAPGAEIHDLKVLGEDGQGSSVQVLRAMEWVIRNDKDIASMSLGTTVNNCDGKDAISRIANRAHNEGIIVIAAAGNEGPKNETIKSPGCAEKAITVGAVNKEDQLATYSSRGNTSDNRVKPDVVAPGTQIVSTAPDDGWRMSSGTSMATPHVTGQAAIIKSQRPNLTNNNVKSIIKDSSQDIGYPKNFQGEGRIDLTGSNTLLSNFTYYNYDREVSSSSWAGRIREIIVDIRDRKIKLFRNFCSI